MVAHIVKREEQPEDAFQELKATLVANHVLSDYQHVEQLSQQGGAARRQEAIQAPGHYAGDLATGARELPLLPLHLPRRRPSGQQKYGGASASPAKSPLPSAGQRSSPQHRKCV
jgi:hypothetical protein